MADRQPLARRILLSFMLLTALIAGINAWAIIAVVQVVEEDLIGDEMRQEMEMVETVYLTEGRIPDLTGGSALYVPTLKAQPLPAAFAGLHPGFQEVVGENGAWHVLETSIEGHRFILARDQGAFEAREQVLYKVVIGGFLLAVALAWLIGRLTVRRVIDPVIRLAGQVRGRDQMVALAPPLAADYGDDELGQLAMAFDLAFSQLRLAIDRERLFTSDVSHELRTPLMIVGTSAELLLRGDLSERARRQVERIARAAAEMRSLIEVFLELARAQGAQLTPGEGVSLAAMADEQSQLWAEDIAARGLSFVRRSEGELPGLWHPTLLRVVMGNLLRNAAHYTERGEIRLILASDGFRVEDTGPGISPAERAQLFQPFVRGRGARGEGLGLGLSLVRRICEQQGWQIDALNLDGGGSCFVVRLGG
ncbi:sensor histidine kinase [Azonexus caeni]|uniref:sensor histidine kinase n=1 Tax=Azonexus caeni TaxID=266126 RepID=UPI003A849811